MLLVTLSIPLLLLSVSAKVILESPQQVKVEPGSPATLHCRTSNSAKILWYKDGTVVGTEGNDRMILPDGSLFFLSTESEDSGSYHCAVHLGSKIYKSENACLTVGEHEIHLHYINYSIDTPRNLFVTPVNENTATVEWSKVPEAGGYVVQVKSSEVKEAITNITVEKEVVKVKLHNLHPDMEYQISVAAKANDVVSVFSSPFSLKLLREPLQVEDGDIPTVLWVVSISVVVIMTILTILGVTVVVIKIRSFKCVNGGIEVDCNIYDKPMFTSKRISWIESPWNFREKKNAPFTTFQSDFLMSEHTSSDYDYATSDHYFLSSDVSSHSHTSNSDSDTSRNMSNHYACTNIS